MQRQEVRQEARLERWLAGLRCCRGEYVGSSAGTAGGLPEGGEGTMKRAPTSEASREDVAVRIAIPSDTQWIVERLRRHGAADVERAKVPGKTATG